MNRSVAIAIALVIIFVAGVAGYFVTVGTQQDHPATMPAPGEASLPAGPTASAIIDFSLSDIDGNVRNLSDWQGKGRLVNFWATWCAPCRREIPLLKQTQESHAEDNIQVIGIAVDFLEEVRAYNEEAQFNYPILVGQEDAMAAAEASGVEFIGLPFTMIVAPSGELLNTHIGEIVESHIDTILGVFDALDDGTMDIAMAREALADL
jgi:thiol-disulfide isomerase/thioredoxin